MSIKLSIKAFSWTALTVAGVIILAVPLPTEACDGKKCSIHKDETLIDDKNKTIYVAEDNVVKKSFDITGMTCEGCVKGIHGSIMGLKGIIDVDVNFESKSASVKYDKTKATQANIIKTITKLGYEVKGGPP